MLKLTRNAEGDKFTEDELKTISLDEVKKMIVSQVPDAFDKKTKKAATKKAPTKKVALKKDGVKKAASAAPKKKAIAKKKA
jgi:DNA topoisomerase I